MRRNFSKQRQHPGNPMDSAALAGTIVAGVLATSTQQGPWDPSSGAIGLTLLIVLLAYELERPRRGLQNVAFGMVCSLSAIMIVGFITELWLSGFNSQYWVELERVNPPASRVNPWYVGGWWCALSVVFTGVGIRYTTVRSQLNANEQEETDR